MTSMVMMSRSIAPSSSVTVKMTTWVPDVVNVIVAVLPEAV